MFSGSLLTTAYEGIDGGSIKTGSTVVMGIHRYIHIGNLHVFIIFILRIVVDNPFQDARRRSKIIGALILIRHSDADDDIGSHLTGHVGRIVITHATVDKHHTV